VESPSILVALPAVSPNDNSSVVMVWRVVDGRRLSVLRKARRLTQEALADQVGVSRVWLGCVERGVKSPSRVVLRKLARVLKVSVREVLPLHIRRPRRRSPIPIPQLTGTEARALLARLDDDDTAHERAAWSLTRRRTRRPLSEMIERHQRLVLRGDNAPSFTAERIVPPEEVNAIAKHTSRGERIETERRRVVLSLVRADKAALYEHPAVRQCYEAAVRGGDLRFLEAFGVAVATLPDRRVRHLDGDLENIRLLQEEENLELGSAISRYVTDLARMGDPTLTPIPVKLRQLRRRLRRQFAKARRTGSA
jgi:transcriptional regulator with XRE-family HTH domain